MPMATWTARTTETWTATWTGKLTLKLTAKWKATPTPKRTVTWKAKPMGCQTARPRRREPPRRHCLAIVLILPFQLVVSNIMLSKAHLSVDCNHTQHQIPRTRG